MNAVSGMRRNLRVTSQNCRTASGAHSGPAELGIWSVLFVSAQRRRIYLEAQARIPHLSGTCTEFANKPKKRIKRDKPEQLAAPEVVNEVWAMDFMHGQLQDGHCIRLLNIIDDFNREGLGIEIDFSLPSERVIRVLENIIEWRGCPREIRCDDARIHERHFSSLGCEKKNPHLYIQPGKPQQNGYAERHNRTMRYD